MANTRGETASQRSVWMNNDVYARNIGVYNATANIPSIPVTTRRDYRHFSAPATPTTTQAASNGAVSNGVPEATYHNYAGHIHQESILKAIHKPLSKCMGGATFMPDATSDLYHNHSLPPTSNTGPQGYTGSNVAGIASRVDTPLPNQSVFSNHTRQQTKALDGQ